MSFESDLMETFAQINAAGESSMKEVDVSIQDDDKIVGNGITGSANALNISGGSLDAIIRSFGGELEGIQGGSPKDKLKYKAETVMSKAKSSGKALDHHLQKQYKSLHDNVVDLENLTSMAKDAVKENSCSKDLNDVLKKIIEHMGNEAQEMKKVLEKDLKQPKQQVSDFLSRNKSFTQAISNLGANMNESKLAGIVSLTFSNVNELKNVGKSVSEALKTVDMKKKEYVGQTLFNLEKELTHKLETSLKKNLSSDKIRAFLKAWKTLLEHHGHVSKIEQFITGGVNTDMGGKLVDRLYKSREELKNIINKFIASFGSDINNIVESTNELSKHLGKDISYTDNTVQFLEAFTRLNEYLSSNKTKFYQHLLEINIDTVDSKEIKTRFLNNLRVLSEKAVAMGSSPIIKKFVSECESAANNVHKFSDMVKSFNDDMKKEGGNSTDVMNELYSVDASKIEISALINPLENLGIAIKKLEFFKNVALFRSNLSQTNKELAGYSKNYEKSVGQAIGQAISRINNEYTEIMNQISDDKSGMGLEIDMYNESLEKDQKISKEKLKMMYKWQCDARIGLYKTIEAIDLYLLHFTDAITKNPDAVSDLNKLLSATKIIARWYDQKSGNNLIRVFESFRSNITDDEIESDDFSSVYAKDSLFADLEIKVGGDRANKIYERCRRAVQGVVVLKNIISYFISLGEKYGDFKSEKSIYMAPSNIYKNLVNYIWVSALDINTIGSEILTDNNETKRLLTYEDTKIKIAQVNEIDPETMGINFNKHSLDKLRILKTHNELLRLKDFTASMGDLEIRRIKQFVSSTFARLGKTKYIFSMFIFGVYDFTQMDKSLVSEFLTYINTLLNGFVDGIAVDRELQDAINRLNYAKSDYDVAVKDVANPENRFNTAILTKIAAAREVDLKEAQDEVNRLTAMRSSSFATVSAANRPTITFVLPNGEYLSTAANLAEEISKLTIEQKGAITTKVTYGYNDYRTRTFVNLKMFLSMPDSNYAVENGIISLNSLSSASITRLGLRNDDQRFVSTDGFMKGFITGLTSSTQEVGSVVYAQRTISSLHYCVMSMLNTYKKIHSSSVFAIDDTYFILSIKAIAGKVMTIAGVNSLFKNPTSYRNTISQNKTRLIMGGADSILEDPEVIDEAVELYVRLPLLVEFYRAIFDNANKSYKQESVEGVLDEEQISYVPEIGNIWSNLIKNIFDKSKHIENGVYTPENMKKIVSEVNAIYKHYKSAVSSENLTRHIVLELVSEINRRYGVIKRQELLNYYRVINATKRNKIHVSESNFSNNDFDILDEEIEFEEKSPSDDYIELKKTFSDKSVSTDVKINKLTDYKILKEFREKINTNLDIAERRLHLGDSASNGFLSMVDRIRMLKKVISSKNSKEEKYDLISKAIEESESMNQSSNDIFVCFHELVVVPLRMLNHMHKALEKFILSIYSVMARVAGENVSGRIQEFTDISNNPLMKSVVKINGVNVPLNVAMLNVVLSREVDELTVNGVSDLTLNFGRGIAKYSSSDSSRVIQDLTNTPITSNSSTAQLLLTDILAHFCQNSGNLAKMSITTTGRITVDLSEYQSLCEYLVSNTKFMIDKFTGLVPTKLIESVTKTNQSGTIYWIEDNLINKIFNKIDKNESERAVICVDNLNKIMPLVSSAVFTPSINVNKVITEFMLSNAPTNDTLSVNTSKALPVIRDAFTEYDQSARIFKTPSGSETVGIFKTLFNPSSSSSIVENNTRYGLVQEFNTLIAHYLNDLYDFQSRKLYTKLFEKFANNAFLEALNGRAFSDFRLVNKTTYAEAISASEQLELYDLPYDSGILSATLAYTMKTMSTRNHPISGVKVYELSSIKEVAPHVLEKYRAYLPMYLRLFKLFLERCKFYRKTLTKINVSSDSVKLDVVKPSSDQVMSNDSLVRENIGDVRISFASDFTSITTASNTDARDKVLLFIDDMVSGISSLIEDASAVHKELREMDTSVPLFFDVKHNFTKSFYLSTRELPYAPLSTLTMGFKSSNQIQPFPTLKNSTNSKFLYGLQSMLIDDFKLSVSKIPYMKKLLSDFNGYNSKVNNISEDKFNDVLKHLGTAFNFYYDWKYFNGQVFNKVSTRDSTTSNLSSAALSVYNARVAVMEAEALVESRRVIAQEASASSMANPNNAVLSRDAQETASDLEVAENRLASLRNSPALTTQLESDVVLAVDNAINNRGMNSTPMTYQELQSPDASLTIIESINPVDSKNKIADYIKNNSVKQLTSFKSSSGDSNPRSRIIMINIVDLGIVPINVHSLMREIPLANLYNYAMTFDLFVDELKLSETQKLLLKKPYTVAKISEVVSNSNGTQSLKIRLNNVNENVVEGLAKGGDSSLRFLNDIVVDQICKPSKASLGVNVSASYVKNVSDRINSKLLRNLSFLTLVQFAIKKKVKQELDFINSRVVSSTSAVSNVITDARVDGVDVSDDIFQF